MWMTRVKAVAAVMLTAVVLAGGVLAFRGPAAEPVPPAGEDSSGAVERGRADRAGPAAGVLDRFKLLQLEQVEKELLQVQSDLRRAQVELARAKARREGDRVSAEVIDERINQDPEVKQLQQRVLKAKDDLSEAEKTVAAGKGEEVLKRAVVAVRNAEEALAERRDRLRPFTGALLAQRAAHRWQDQVVRLEDRVGFLHDLEQALSNDLARLGRELGRPPASLEERLRTLENEVAQLKATVEGLQKRR